MKNDVVTGQLIKDSYRRAYPDQAGGVYNSLVKAHVLKDQVDDIKGDMASHVAAVSFLCAAFALFLSTYLIGPAFAKASVSTTRNGLPYTPDSSDYGPLIVFVFALLLFTLAPLVYIVTKKVLVGFYSSMHRSSTKSPKLSYLKKMTQVQEHQQEFTKLAEVLDIAISDVIKDRYGTVWVHTEHGYQITIPGEYGYNAWIPSDVQHVIKNSEDKITVKDGDFEVSVPYKWHPDKGIVLHYTPVAPVTPGVTG